MSEVKNLLHGQVVPLLHRIDERLNHTASKVDLSNVAADLRSETNDLRIEMSTRLMGIQAELAERPTRSYLCGWSSASWSPPFLPPPSGALPWSAC